jgi:transcriptional regulator with XRE-family HTH domain
MRKYQNRLRDLRHDRDLTQAQVAELFFLQLTQYRRYENGESDLPLECAKKFAIYYNVSIDYIAGIIDTPRKIF